MSKVVYVTFQRTVRLIAPDNATKDQLAEAGVLAYNEYSDMDGLYMIDDDVVDVTVEHAEKPSVGEEIDFPEVYETGGE